MLNEPQKKETNTQFHYSLINYSNTMKFYILIVSYFLASFLSYSNTSIQELKELSKNGNTEAQFTFAQHLLKGELIHKDSLSAYYWLYRSARGGWTNRLPKEGSCNVKAAKFLKKLADAQVTHTSAHAKRFYGNLCDYILQQDSIAETYYHNSFEAGCLESAFDLAYMYYWVDYASLPDFTTPHRFFTFDFVSYVNEYDLNKGNNNDSSRLDSFRNREHKFENDNAIYWFNLAMKCGGTKEIGRTHLLLANIYFYSGDYINASTEWEAGFEYAVHTFNEYDAKLILADLYVLSDYKIKRAVRIYNDCLDSLKEVPTNEPNKDLWTSWTSCGIGKCYYLGKGVEQSYQTAVKYFKVAADKNDPEGLHLLSRCYRSGRGVTQDISMAESLLNQAESLDNRIKRGLKQLKN